MKGMSLLILSFIFSLYDASRLNMASKISLKSIKSPDGDTIDCVDIYHQPAFGHPLLKNHSISMRPSYIPRKGPVDGETKMFNFTTDSQEDSDQITQPWQLNGKCPEGTIPILRTKTQDFLRASSIKSIPHRFSARTQITDQANHERDGYGSTGCYNLLCSGFVQVSKEVALGAAINPVSAYHGSQYIITISMWKDPKTKAWWLVYGKDTYIGYWPESLFTTLATSATGIEWGGEVINLNRMGKHTTTQMGSGHFAEEEYGGASFFRDLRVVYRTRILGSPNEFGKVVDRQNCYNIKFGHSKAWGDFFYYGGPGNNPKCP